MSAENQTGVQQRAGYTNQEEYTNEKDAGYTNQEEYTNEKGFGGPQGGYGPQGYPAQQGYGPQGGDSYPNSYQGQQLGNNEYVDKRGRIRKKDGGKFAAFLVLCWCITWPCHGPCCGGL